MGDWKYIWRATGFNGWTPPPEQGKVDNNGNEDRKVESGEDNEEITDALFNLNNDPLEKENLAETETQLAAAMLDRLKQYLENLSDVTYPPQDNSGKPSNFDGVWSSGWC